jgi:hypothetical protein
MRKIYRVAQREFVETVKTRTFLLGLLVVPLIIGSLILFGPWFAPRPDAPRPPVRVRVTSSSQALSAEIKAVFNRYNLAHPLGSITLDMAGSGGTAGGQSGRRRGHDPPVHLQGQTFPDGCARDGGTAPARGGG